MKNKTNTIIILIIVSILFVVIAGGAFVFGRILNGKVNKVVQLRQGVASVEDLANVVTVKHELEKLEEYEDILDSYFIQGSQAVDFIEVIEDLGKVSGVKLEVQDININKILQPASADSGSATETEYSELNMIVSAQGSWNGITKLLLLFENYPQYLTVTDLRLTASENSTSGSQEWLVNYKLKGLTH